MSIVEETRIALLDLFPEQAAADAEARAAAEAEAEAAEAAAAVQAEIDAAAAEMESMDLTADASAEPEEGAAGEEAAEPEAKAAATKKEPEEEGPRENGVLLTDHAARGAHIDVLCDPDQIVESARIMNEAGFFLESIAGVDWIKEDKIEVIYDYNQYGMEPCRVVVRAFIDRAEPEIATISEIFPSADWHERETFDFYGINFQGHPYLVPILLPEDADFHPLLKDFKP
ncbi:MAG: NADH-quinone oxidoreductase subunit C [Desulfobulbaceae bacterium]|nr:NADH-quinone oxidoreductase subunit C [Desulfobulbaceae bacterium]